MSARKRVRVTIEGWALLDGEFLRIHLSRDDRYYFLADVYNVKRENVTVEELPEPRDWRAGDVIVWGSATWVRCYGDRWATAPVDPLGATLADADVDRWVAEGARVLRYQAEEESGT